MQTILKLSSDKIIHKKNDVHKEEPGKCLYASFSFPLGVDHQYEKGEECNVYGVS